MLTDEAMYSPRAQVMNQVVALGLIVFFVAALAINVGVPPTIIVGGSAIVGFGIAEFTHFIFPLITPALEATNPAPITAFIKGVSITDMANHHIAVTGKYYFPGFYTAIIPMIPGIYTVWWLLKNRNAQG